MLFRCLVLVLPLAICSACSEMPDFIRQEHASPVVIFAGQIAQGSVGSDIDSTPSKSSTNSSASINNTPHPPVIDAPTVTATVYQQPSLQTPDLRPINTPW